MNKQELSKLALKLYIDKSHWHARFVKYLINDMSLNKLLGYDLGEHNGIKDDISKLRELIEIANCQYVDLQSPKELLLLSCYLPEAEAAEKEKRIEKHCKEKMGDDLYDTILALVDSDCNLDDLEGMPKRLREDIKTARYNSNLYNT
jgi:hypothetical protein